MGCVSSGVLEPELPCLRCLLALMAFLMEKAKTLLECILTRLSSLRDQVPLSLKLLSGE